MNIPQKQAEKLKSRQEQITERLAQIPESQRRIYIKAVGRKSMAAAVKSFCYECVGYAREEVKVCSDLGCPLWMYRPGRSFYRKAKIERFSAIESTNGISDRAEAAESNLAQQLPSEAVSEERTPDLYSTVGATR